MALAQPQEFKPTKLVLALRLSITVQWLLSGHLIPILPAMHLCTTKAILPNLSMYWTGGLTWTKRRDNTFNRYPAGTFAVPSGSSSTVSNIIQQVSWVQPGWCGWSCETLSSYYAIVFLNPSWWLVFLKLDYRASSCKHLDS